MFTKNQCTKNLCCSEIQMLGTYTIDTFFHFEENWRVIDMFLGIVQGENAYKMNKHSYTYYTILLTYYTILTTSTNLLLYFF